MESLRTVWSDIARDLKQASADLEIPVAQGMYWTLVCADRMRMQHIVKRRSGAFLSTFVLPVENDPKWADRRFVTLPSAIYDIDLDAGIESLSYYDKDECSPIFKRVIFFRTDPSRLNTRSKAFYQRATRDHPYFWREHEKLYLDGQDSDLEFIEAKIYATLPDITAVDLDAPFDFPRELMVPLKKEILAMGRFVLAIPGQYLKNDGTNRPAEQTTLAPQTSSVNSEFAHSPND